MTPRISIVIPTKNRAALLGEVVRSLQAQTFGEWEAVVVDDGSRPEELAATRALADGDPRIRVLPRDSAPLGGCHCRNLGLRAARSELIVFFDDDDLLSPGCLAERVRVMQEDPGLDFAVFPYERFRESPGDMGERVVARDADDHLDAFLRIRPPWHTGGPVWRRGFLERMGGWHEEVTSWQDWEFGIHALSLRPRYRCFDGPSFFVRVASQRHSNISGAGWSPHHVKTWPIALEAVVRHLRSAELLDRTRHVLVARLHLFMAERLVDVGEPALASQVWRRARREGFAGWHEALIGDAVLFAARRRLHRRFVRMPLLALQEAELLAARLSPRRPARR